MDLHALVISIHAYLNKQNDARQHILMGEYIKKNSVHILGRFLNSVHCNTIRFPQNLILDHKWELDPCNQPIKL